jgi:hypothetical protein
MFRSCHQNAEESHNLREERRLQVFENRVLKRKFGLNREEEAVAWRRLHNEER